MQSSQNIWLWRYILVLFMKCLINYVLELLRFISGDWFSHGSFLIPFLSNKSLVILVVWQITLFSRIKVFFNHFATEEDWKEFFMQYRNVQGVAGIWERTFSVMYVIVDCFFFFCRLNKTEEHSGNKVANSQHFVCLSIIFQLLGFHSTGTCSIWFILHWKTPVVIVDCVHTYVPYSHFCLFVYMFSRFLSLLLYTFARFPTKGSNALSLDFGWGETEFKCLKCYCPKWCWFLELNWKRKAMNVCLFFFLPDHLIIVPFVLLLYCLYVFCCPLLSFCPIFI